MSRSADAQFALAVIARRVDLTDPGIAARLALVRARYLGDEGLRRMVDRAASVHAAVLEGDPRAVDAAYLRAVASGAVDLLNDPVWERLEPIHGRHAHDPEMMRLFEEAAEAYSDAAVDAAAAVLSGPAADDAIRKAQRSRA